MDLNTSNPITNASDVCVISEMTEHTSGICSYVIFSSSYAIFPWHETNYLSLLQIGSFVPVPKGYLSRFWNRDKAAGTKALEAFVPGGRTGTKCPSR